MPRKSTYDYSKMKWSIEMDKQTDVPEDHMYRDSLSLVVENTGTKTIKESRSKFTRPSNRKRGRCGSRVSRRPGDHYDCGKAATVALVLGDSILAGGKRRYSFERKCQSEAAFQSDTGSA
jgi:hypothetical protein